VLLRALQNWRTHAASTLQQRVQLVRDSTVWAGTLALLLVGLLST
jgi:hypothetical protein